MVELTRLCKHTSVWAYVTHLCGMFSVALYNLPGRSTLMSGLFDIPEDLEIIKITNDHHTNYVIMKL